MRVLGLETSCDDTGVAVYDSERGLLAHSRYSQMLHADYGGVVPELASRDHIRKLLPLIKEVLLQAGIARTELNAVAYTAGPGLAGALLVGAAVGRSLSWGLGIPAIGIHHMEGHLLSPMLEVPAPRIPFLALLVSGGHTLLADVQGIGRYQILGESVDDAVGEAFDKTAQLLGLDYPGGPAIAAAAEHGEPGRFRFPRPMTDRPGLDFSFSGLKTAVATTAQQQHSLDPQTVADIAQAFQHAAIDTLRIKCQRALQQSGHKQLVVAGGVSANQLLRQALSQLAAEVFFPRLEFSTDNGAMIAYAGAIRLQAGQQQDASFAVHPRWAMETLHPL